MEWKVILEVGSEGGKISLLGSNDEKGNWSFKKFIDQLNFNHNFNEVDIVLTKQVETIDICVNNQTLIVDDWDSAINLLEEHSWVQLTPITVHPEFQKKVWKEVLASKLSKQKKKKWQELCFSHSSNVGKFSSLFQEAEYAIVLTGDGFLPVIEDTNQSRENEEIWKYVNPKSISTLETLKSNYSIFQQYFINLVKKMKHQYPAKGHFILADFEKENLIKSVITQRIDGIHQKAGSKNIYELHGSLQSFYCSECNTNCTKQKFIEGKDCFECGGSLRPQTILIGENLPSNLWKGVVNEVKKADLIIAIGVNESISSFKKLLSINPCKKILIGQEPTKFTKDSFDICIEENPNEILKELHHFFIQKP
jgi:NAD-dependent SIR2 family protein deacetylase